MKVWVVIFQDSHFDVEVEVWNGPEGARMRAWEWMREICGDRAHVEMNQRMVQAGWVLNLESYEDGPSVRVVESRMKA